MPGAMTGVGVIGMGLGNMASPLALLDDQSDLRFDQQFQAAKRFLDDEDLGDLIALESHYVHDMQPAFAFTPWRLEVPQDFMFGGCVHALDVIRALGGDIESVHANAAKNGLTPAYPLSDNFFIRRGRGPGARGDRSYSGASDES